MVDGAEVEQQLRLATRLITPDVAVSAKSLVTAIDDVDPRVVEEFRRVIADLDVNQTFEVHEGTLLQHAACQGSLWAVEILLRGGADPSLADVFGQTVLYLAVASGADASAQSGLPFDDRVIKVLVQAGADPFVSGSRPDGRRIESPFEMAEFYGWTSLVEWFSRPLNRVFRRRVEPICKRGRVDDGLT